MRCKRWASVVTIGLSAGTLAGCGKDHVGSSALKTSGMYADFKATADGSKTKVDAQLFVEDRKGDFVTLEAGDSLLASINDETPLELRPNASEENYLHTFDVSEAGTLVTIDFERRDRGDKDAPDSHVRLPEAFDMSLDVSGKVQRDQDVVMTWEPSGISNQMYWLVDGDCIWPKDGSTDDDGRYTLKAGSQIEVLSTRSDESCKITVTLERHVHGTIDPAFRDGRFLGIQARTRTFTSVPEEPDEEGTGGSGNDETGGSGNTETGGSANEAGAPGAGTAGSPPAAGGTGTGGATGEEAGAAGAAAGGSSTGGSTQAATAGTAGAVAGSTGASQAAAGSAGASQAAAGSPGASGQGGAGGQG
ncbi:MAG: hypothetical protein JW940_34775 [Polyangiaceae bacterium]|nr:hypothetical protein [Polyangiaceae bacterium]